jgi:hypothetical protein
MRVFFSRHKGIQLCESTHFEFISTTTSIPRFEVYSQFPMDEVRKFLGMEDLEVGDAAFDAAFVVKSEDPAWLRRVLGADLRAGLLQWRATDRDWRNASRMTHVRGGAKRFELHVDGLLSEAELQSLLDSALRLVDGLGLLVNSAFPSDAQRVSMGDSSAAEWSTCLVCGDVLSDRTIVCCPRCETPHHEECWKYNGECAVYACHSHPGRRRNVT